MHTDIVHIWCEMTAQVRVSRCKVLTFLGLRNEAQSGSPPKPIVPTTPAKAGAFGIRDFPQFSRKRPMSIAAKRSLSVPHPAAIQPQPCMGPSPQTHTRAQPGDPSSIDLTLTDAAGLLFLLKSIHLSQSSTPTRFIAQHLPPPRKFLEKEPSGTPAQPGHHHPP